MEEFCLQCSIAIDDWITEIGGGMNLKRKRFLEWIQQSQIAK